MIMGQSAGIIAGMSFKKIGAGGAVHDIDTTALHSELIKGGQYMNDVCVAVPPPVPHAAAYSVAGSGDALSNGVYRLDPTQRRDFGVAFYTMNAERQLYRIDGVWRIAHTSVAVYYENTAAINLTTPPSTGWTAVSGAMPTPTLSTHARHVQSTSVWHQ